MHYSRWRDHGSLDSPWRTVEDRFWEKVEKTDGCWLWTASKNHLGYGQFGWTYPDGRRTMRGSHRVAYELVKGPIPEGTELDHLCRVPACVNPDHLDPVTHEVNVNRGAMRPVGEWHAAKTHCAKGHPYDEANTLYAGGQRMCRECRKEWGRISRERRKARHAA